MFIVFGRVVDVKVYANPDCAVLHLKKKVSLTSCGTIIRVFSVRVCLVCCSLMGSPTHRARATGLIIIFYPSKEG